MQKDGGNLIDRQAALDALGERPTVWTDDDDYALGERTQYDMDRLAIETVPSAQPEHLCTVMERIKEKYAKAMNTPCIHNPMAWALYQVWKEYDK